MVTTSILLSFLFASGVLADCPEAEASLFITSPRDMEALNGSCLLIPCTFSARSQEEFNNQTEAIGVWIKNYPYFDKNPDNVIFDSSRNENTYQMSFIGNLREKNCTTLFFSLLTAYSDTYFFRYVNQPFRATAICNKLRIVVRDSPPRPRIEISSGNLRERETVTITCSASTPCPQSPPELTWNLQQDSDSRVEENTNGSFTTTIQETIELSDQHDRFNITCSAGYPVNEGKDIKTEAESLILSVSYAPKETTVSMSPFGPVSAGTLVNLTCWSRANPPISHFTWFRSGKDGPMTVAEGHFYSFNATDGGVYHCVAKNDLGKDKSEEVHLNIEGAEPNRFLPLGAVVGGIIGIVVFICVVVAIRWFKSKHPTSQQTQSHTAEEPADQEPAKETETEDIFYGEINFSKRKPEPSSASAQDSGQPQDTVYAQVNVTRAAKSFSKSADSPESIYAQVKRK